MGTRTHIQVYHAGARRGSISFDDAAPGRGTAERLQVAQSLLLERGIRGAILTWTEIDTEVGVTAVVADADLADYIREEAR